MALRPISFRWPEEFVALIDAARGDVSRSKFIRHALADNADVRAVLQGRRRSDAEQALSGEPNGASPTVERAAALPSVARPSAPAEQPSRADMFRRATGGQR